MTSAGAPLLAVEGLSVDYASARESVPAVRDVSLGLSAGRTLAVVGESGSGKSTTATALVGLSGENARVRTTRHELFGQDLRTAGEKTWREMRGRRIGYIPQDAGTGLNPVRTLGGQLLEAVRTLSPSKEAAEQRVLEVLEDVGLDPLRHRKRYPHELSGGQRQRALIALGLAARPGLVVADEPTSALDVTVQKQILDLLERLVAENDAALMLITHDLGVAEDRADEIVVMRGGRIEERGPSARVLAAPASAYTRELLDAVPRIPTGHVEPARIRSASPGQEPWAQRPVEEPAVRVDQLTKVFGRGAGAVTAVDRVSFEVARGSTFGLVGESGSGKSTTARVLLGLEAFDAGRIRVLGHEVTGSRKEAVRLARRAQYVHQDPSASLDPRWDVGRSIAEPLEGFGLGDRRARRQRVHQLLDLVGLPATTAERRPRELSGGQRQRVAIARGLATNPDLLVLDEPVSALDVSVQSRILRLLRELQEEMGLTYVFISHDLAVIRDIADSVALMARGRVEEIGPVADVFTRPASAVTRALLEAVPGRRRSAGAKPAPLDHRPATIDHHETRTP